MDGKIPMVDLQPSEKISLLQYLLRIFLEKKSIGTTVFGSEGDGFSNWKRVPRN